MKCKFILFLLAASVLICFRPVQAQPTKVPRIGYLTGSALSPISDRTNAFRQGLRELGYVEGKNIFIEWRSAEGNRDRQRALAAELVRLKVDVILAASGGRYARSQGGNRHDSHCHGFG
jgi:putative ABC transport system substrate-binding protein